MRQPSELRDPTAVLSVLSRAGDLVALQEHLSQHADELGAAAGVGSARIREHAQSEVAGRAARELLERSRQVRRLRLERDALSRSGVAARDLVRTARWVDGEPELDVGLLLGDLLSHRASHLVLGLAGSEVVVRRTELMGLRRLRRRLSGLSARLTPEALVFSWNGGRGGLRLHCQTARAKDLESALRLYFAEPIASAPPPGSWLRDALASVLDQLAAQ